MIDTCGVRNANIAESTKMLRERKSARLGKVCFTESLMSRRGAPTCEKRVHPSLRCGTGGCPYFFDFLRA